MKNFEFTPREFVNIFETNISETGFLKKILFVYKNFFCILKISIDTEKNALILPTIKEISALIG